MLNFREQIDTWVADLVPNELLDGPNLGSRAIKLIDARTNRALTNKPAHITFNGMETLEMKTKFVGLYIHSS